MMTKNPSVFQDLHVTRELFAQYCDGPFQNTLALLSLPMKKTSLKFKQAAARALGYSCYESLVAQWARTDLIRNGMVLESCETQGGRMTVKCKNILFVYDPSAHTFYGMSLRPGEEGRRIGIHLEDSEEDLASLPLPEGAVLCAHQSMKAFRESVEQSLQLDTGAVRASLIYQCVDDEGNIQQGTIEFCRTFEGLIIDLYSPDEDASSASVGLMFSDRQFSESGDDAVDLSIARPCYTGHLGISYQWMKTDVDHDGRDRLLHIDPDEEVSISELLFESREKAIEAIESEAWGYSPEHLTDIGAVLVETTMRIMPSPY